ncbi:FAD-dependent oxidoreductase [Pseudomonas sp. EL_65y_Pfl2_R95]|uniref:FAD-dependent oxidoreductase n=1 Tax=Pseudomonas sp. EL_65y_Pfl2_R95 TaxID=3088698 RepID=UPI0030D88D7E
MNDYDLILVGAGHAHLGVLRRWAMLERPPGRIALVSADHHAWYSGMLPGLLAGRFSAEDCSVELQPMCRAAKVDLIIDEVISISAEQRQVQLRDGRQLNAKWLSLNVGGQVSPLPQQGDAMHCLAVKPFAQFLTHWQTWQQAPKPLAIIGGGAAGVELALALAEKVPQLSLFCAGKLLAGHNPGLHLRAIGALRQRRVRLREYSPVSRIEGDQLFSEDDLVWRGERVLLATGAQALPWLGQSGLRCDARGFVQIMPTLQSDSHRQIFAAGDCASLPGALKSGVYSVRQAPVLANNLMAALKDQPLKNYRPQKHSLALLATGDGGALLAWRGLSASGQIYGRWKDYLDQSFIRRHRFVG